jgi:carbonic anhydrase/acetyltransferase-like protein (isoleucine patch superfamily)
MGEGRCMQGKSDAKNILRVPQVPWFKEPIEPRIAQSSHISQTAVVIGDVDIGENVYVAPAVSIRGDEGAPIFVGNETNVQDGVIMHALLHQHVRVDGRDYAIYIGDKVCCAHGAIIHGPCFVGHNTFIGFNAVIFKAEVGMDCAVLHNAVVTGGVKIPDGRMVPIAQVVDTQEKADALPPITDDLRSLKEEVVEVNIEFARGYREQLPVGNRI